MIEELGGTERDSAELQKEINRLNQEIGALKKKNEDLKKESESHSKFVDVSASRELEDADKMEVMANRNDELSKALEALVDRYIANRGTDSEFIRCITPSSSRNLTTLERLKDATWSLWDKARILIGE